MEKTEQTEQNKVIEEEDKDINLDSIDSLNPKFLELFNNIYLIIDKKSTDLIKTINNKSNEYIKKADEVVTNYTEESSQLNNEVNKRFSKTPQTTRSQIEKKEEIQELKNLRGRFDKLISNIETVKKIPELLEKYSISDILRFSDCNLSNSIPENIISPEISANSILSDTCVSCREKLIWNSSSYSSYTKKCNLSKKCNNHFRYACNSCKIKYCTNCAFPPCPEYCGCTKKMEKLSVSGHVCDVCEKSLYETVYRCTSCDYDVCTSCFENFESLNGKSILYNENAKDKLIVDENAEEEENEDNEDDGNEAEDDEGSDDCSVLS